MSIDDYYGRGAYGGMDYFNWPDDDEQYDDSDEDDAEVDWSLLREVYRVLVEGREDD